MQTYLPSKCTDMERHGAVCQCCACKIRSIVHSLAIRILGIHFDFCKGSKYVIYHVCTSLTSVVGCNTTCGTLSSVVGCMVCV